MPGATSCIPSRLDNVGGTLQRSISKLKPVCAGGAVVSISTWKVVYAGGINVCELEAPTQREARL